MVTNSERQGITSDYYVISCGSPSPFGLLPLVVNYGILSHQRYDHLLLLSIICLLSTLSVRFHGELSVKLTDLLLYQYQKGARWKTGEVMRQDVLLSDCLENLGILVYCCTRKKHCVECLCKLSASAVMNCSYYFWG